jgi:hypothetical protein
MAPRSATGCGSVVTQSGVRQDPPLLRQNPTFAHLAQDTVLPLPPPYHQPQLMPPPLQLKPPGCRRGG